MSKTITRQQLYDLVWSEPVKNLAPQFGGSDVWLSKLCAASWSMSFRE